jgi:glycosyltransferase involved in cell wall biosynthesis
MVEILNGELLRNETNTRAMGGTELIATEMHKRIPQEFLEGYQIIHSRPRQLYDDLKKILILHDLAGDPEVQHLKEGGWNKYDKLVFVSNWQMQQYNLFLGVPYNKSLVIQNAINPVQVNVEEKPKDKVKIIYHTTPHRGLNILYTVFEILAKEFDFIELDVYSSFKIYGWEVRDEQYKEVFDKCREHPQINYHGSVSNDEVKKALAQAHIFAYPSIWQETSCISLMEAMSAGCLCVHPNYAALPETAANWTQMYQWNEDINAHAGMFHANLRNAILVAKNGWGGAFAQKNYADIFYSWDNRQNQWISFLKELT